MQFIVRLNNFVFVVVVHSHECVSVVVVAVIAGKQLLFSSPLKKVQEKKFKLNSKALKSQEG